MSEVTPFEFDRDAVLYLLGLPQGRRFIWDLLSASRLFQQTYRPGDSELSTFLAGNRNLGIMVYAAILEASPDLTAMMTKEQSDAARNNSERTDDRASNSGHSSTGPRGASLGSSGDTADSSPYHGLGFGEPGTVEPREPDDRPGR